MNFLIPTWYHAHLDEIIYLLRSDGHTTFLYEEQPRNYQYDPVFRRKFLSICREKKIDLIFSLQFFPILSNFCNQYNLPYLSWCCNDSMNVFLYSDSIFHSCNYIFHTDTHYVEKLKKLGAENVFYLAWAVTPPKPEAADTNSETDYSSVSIVSHTYPAVRLAYAKMLECLDQRTIGFLAGLLDAQEKIYGFNFIETALNLSVLERLKTSFPLKPLKNSFITAEEQYAYELLYPVLTETEAAHIREKLSESILPGHIYEGKADTGISIYVAPRMIQNGIPAEAMDILGQGHLLFTHFQNDYLNFFEPDEDFVFYESPDDLLDKLNYFLSNENAQRKIISHMQEKLYKRHTFKHRISEMLQIIQI